MGPLSNSPGFGAKGPLGRKYSGKSAKGCVTTEGRSSRRTSSASRLLRPTTDGPDSFRTLDRRCLCMSASMIRTRFPA